MEKHYIKFIPNAGLGNQLYFFTYCNYLREVLGKEVYLLIFESENAKEGDTFNKEIRNPILGLATLLDIPIKKVNSKWEYFQLRWHKVPFYDFFLRKIINIFEEKGWAVFDDFKKNKSFRINIHIGYYQAYQYLTDNFKASLYLKIQQSVPESKYDILENDVAVHIRRGDFKKFPEIFNLIDVDYYRKALKVVSSRKQINKVYIFSDNFDEISDIIGVLDKEYDVILVQNQSVLQDFGLLMKFCNYVVGNSTFSWWAAKLSECKNPNVVVPKEPVKVMNENSTPYPKDWIVLDN